MNKNLSACAVVIIMLSALGHDTGVFAAQDYKNTYKAEVQEHQESAASFMSRASNKFLKKDIQGAIKEMDSAVSLAPSSPLLLLNRGYLKQVAGDLNGALSDYNAAIASNPNYIWAYNNRGVLKAAMGDVAGAMEDYKQALNINENYADVYYNRGNLKYMISDNQGALEDYDKAIALNPKDSDAYNNRGVVKKRMDFNVGALSDYSQAIALNPKDSIAYSNRGKLKKLYFDNEGAAIDLDQAIALAETQTFIKNVKPLVSNERYIAAVPIVEGITPDNPKLVKISPAENEKLVETTVPKQPAIKQTSVASSKSKQGGSTTKLAMANNVKEKVSNIKPAVTKVADSAKKENTSNNVKSKNVISAGIGTVKAIEPPDIRTTKITQTPTTNTRLAESYYIRGLQKCVLKDLQGALADLDKAIANNAKYADAYFYRGAIRKELGDMDGFKKDYATAIQINPALQAFNDSNALALVRG